MSLKFKEDKNKDKEIADDEIVKMTEYVESKKLKIVNTSNTKNHIKNYKRLNKDEYYDKAEKKVKKYKKSDVRPISGISQSMKKVGDYVMNNFNGGNNEKFVTFTYENPMNDMEQLKKDYDYFWKRLKMQMQDLEYLYVVEMQEERKSLHIHALIKDTKHSELHIPFQELTRLWNKGYVWISRINIRDTKTLVIPENKDERTAIGRVRKYMTKIRTKENLPRNKNIYSKSDGIIAPKTTAIPNIKAEQFANENEYEFYYGYSGNLITPKGFLVATITGKFYKKKTTEEE